MGVEWMWVGGGWVGVGGVDVGGRCKDEVGWV